MPDDHASLIIRERLSSQPCSTSFAVKFAWIAREKIGMQHRLHAVLETCHMRNELTTFGDPTAQGFRLVVGHPDLRQEAARMQFGKNRRIDLVRLDFGVRDHAHLTRIGHDHATDMRPQEPNHN